MWRHLLSCGRCNIPQPTGCFPLLLYFYYLWPFAPARRSLFLNQAEKQLLLQF
jgi:hypothetical protein